MDITTNEKTRYSDVELEEFKQLIEEKLEGAKSELKYFQTQIIRSSQETENNRGGFDDGSNSMEKESLNKLASRQVKYIHHLENALIRIANKNFGICRETGKLISKQRLQIVPHATLSINAKKAMK